MVVNAKDNALSNVDMDKLLQEIDSRGLNWIKSSNIKNNMTVDDLFDDYGHLVIWHPWNKNSAHWICILRNPNKEYFYFDSFGAKHDVIKEKEILHILKKDSDKSKLFVNDITFQKDDSAVCGRYCVLLIGLNKIFQGDFKAIDNCLKTLKSKYKNLDELLLDIIYEE